MSGWIKTCGGVWLNLDRVEVISVQNRKSRPTSEGTWSIMASMRDRADHELEYFSTKALADAYLLGILQDE